MSRRFLLIWVRREKITLWILFLKMVTNPFMLIQAERLEGWNRLLWIQFETLRGEIDWPLIQCELLRAEIHCPGDSLLERSFARLRHIFRKKPSNLAGFTLVYFVRRMTYTELFCQGPRRDCFLHFGQMFCIVATQLYHCSTKAAVGTS